MARLQDYPSVTPTANDKFLIVQPQGQGLATLDTVVGVKMDKANPTGTGKFSMNRKSGSTEGTYSSTLGKDCTASGEYSHAEGYNTTASSSFAHAEGGATTASGAFGHAEGGGTTASGQHSHSEGQNTIANHASQHVFGQYNVADTSSAAATARGNYVEIVGKGTADNARSNARTLDWNGNEVLAGGLTIGGSLPLISKGTHNMQGVIIATSDGKYEMIIAVPFNATNVTVTSSQFRPARQTAISESSPTIDKGVGFITVGTSSSSFANYVNKKGIATITIS